MRGRREPVWWALGAIVLAGALLRFLTLDTQSFLYDEAGTVEALRPGLGGVFRAVWDLEASPPGYFVLAWVWTKVFGSGEVGLRSLSAVLGTLTIPVVYLIGRELLARRVGVVAAALAAFNPMFVWYSQEARSYALFVLLASLSFLFFVRSLKGYEARDLALWAVASALALTAHYFATFVVAAEAVWLLLTAGAARRRALTALIPVAGAGLALLPLALHQNTGANAPKWIGTIPLDERMGNVAREVLTANAGLVTVASPVYPPGWWGLLGAVGVVAGLGFLFARATADERRALRPAAWVAGAVIAVPLGLAMVGNGYFYDRNLIAAWVPLIVILAGGFAAARAGRAGIGAAAALCAVGLAVNVTVAADDSLHRADWRAASERVGAPSSERAVLLAPFWAVRGLAVYRPRRGAELVAMPPTGTRARELVFVGYGASAALRPARIGGFALRERRQLHGLALGRYASATAIALTPSALSRDPVGRGAAILVDRPRG